MDGASAPVEPDWRAAVTVRENVELARLLAERLPPPSASRSVSVTDLIGPRRAFWQVLHPVPVGAARQERMDAGRSVHRRLGAALRAEGALEVRVRREGVVGRIDVLSDVPVEVKTSASTVRPDQLRDARPEQAEQLAIYCALADRPRGRLVTLVVAEGEGERVQAVDLGIADLSAVRGEVRHRVEALRRAWTDGRAADLPACRWFGRGCEFQVAGVCDCSSADPPPDRTILEGVRDAADRPDVAERVRVGFRSLPVPTEPSAVERFRELLYLRRTYFERVSPRPRPELPRRDPRDPVDLYGRLTEAVESGPIGEVCRVPPLAEEPEEEVGGFRGLPHLLRVSRAHAPASASTLLDHQPQYALELGFRCVATGAASAYLFLGRERAEAGAMPLQAFELRFDPASVFSRLWRERRRRLLAALVQQAPETLPACPAWMYPDCPYRADCRCDVGGTRSQR
ncbi:MAG: hypothetical protein ACRECT_01295 [Thermoplasmata archaeon]